MKTGAVILAAGLSSRMGVFKPLLEIADKTMLNHCIHLCKKVDVDRIVIISGHRTEEIKKAVKTTRVAKGKKIQVVENHRFKRGMFSSIQLGAATIDNCDCFFLLPVDIPLVRPATLAALLAAFRKGKNQTLLPAFCGKTGHPPLIPKNLQRKIVQAGKNAVLRDILAENSCKKIEMWDAAILRDADTPQAYKALCKAASRRDILQPQEAEIFAELYVPQRVLPHCKKVAETALLLAKALPKKENINLELVYGAALLHDVAKGKPHHEKAGAEMLHRFGLSRMAEIVAAHKDLPPPASGKLTEKEIVCLADKLIYGTEKTGIKKRFNKKMKIYQEDKNACRAIRKRMLHAEALADLWVKTTGKKLS